MALNDWVEETVERYQVHGVEEATRRSIRELLLGAVRRFGRAIPAYGDYIFEQEWDVLIVLDACRWDALEEVKDEYEWLQEDILKFTSRGSHSREWMNENFVDKYSEEKRNTDYICWNAFESYELDRINWSSLDPVWTTGWDDELGCVPPREITDRAIKKHRQSSGRTLIHYMQPHTPYRSIEKVERLSHDKVGEIGAGRTTIWNLINEGKISHDEAWDAYIDNLRWVLDDIELLLENLDAEKVALTADHGECFGEWLLYGHPQGVKLPVLKHVPWVELSAEDTHSHEPDFKAESEMDTSVEDRLEQLGYI